jgi:hypothetical protein
MKEAENLHSMPRHLKDRKTTLPAAYFTASHPQYWRSSCHSVLSIPPLNVPDDNGLDLHSTCPNLPPSRSVSTSPSNRLRMIRHISDQNRLVVDGRVLIHGRRRRHSPSWKTKRITDGHQSPCGVLSSAYGVRGKTYLRSAGEKKTSSSG